MDAIDSTETAHKAHDASDPFKSRAALLVSILAMVLAITSLGGSNATKEAMHANIMASNTYAFYQAKNIRQTDYKLAAEALELELLSGAALPSAARERMSKTFEDYKKNIARYESEPDTGEGRKELAARAKAAEAKRDRSLAAYHHYELASAGVQIAIVMASASIITGMTALVWIAAGLGVFGVVFCGIGFFAPLAVHLF